MTDADVILAREISRDELLAELRALRPVFAREGVTHMHLFGSRARGDNRPDSDVDLAIEVERDRRFSGLDLVGIHHIVQDNIRLPANVSMLRSLKPDFRRRFDRDKVAVF